jgi:hypothetical protein
MHTPTPDEITHTREDIVPDAAIGGKGKRGAVDMAVLKYALGWPVSPAIRRSLLDHCLINVRYPTHMGQLNRKGKHYLRAMQADTTPETILKAMKR